MTEIPPHLAARMPAVTDADVGAAFDAEASAAFAAALASIEPLTKTQTADTGKYTYRYVSLGEVMEEVKRVCELHGLVFTQVPTVVDGHLAVNLWLLHKNGGQVHFDPLMMVLPKEAQAYGSALTYAKRYQLVSVFGIPTEDDDGRAATVAAQTQPGRRSEAERMIRESVGTMDEAMRTRFVADFKGAFGQTLTDLPVARHGDALTWSREWQREREAEALATQAEADAADAAFIAVATETPS